MIEVRRKKVRRMNKKRRALILLAVAAVGFGAGYTVWKGNQTTVIELPRKEDTTTVFSDRENSQVLSMTVNNGRGETYTVYQTDGVWYMQGEVSFAFDDSALYDLLYEGAQVVTEYTVGRLSELNGITYADYGLEAGNCITASMTYDDGSTLAYRVGDLVPEETPRYYFCTEGDDTIYIVSRDMQETLCLSSRVLHTVPNLALNADLIDRVSFTGENAFTIENRTEGWYMTAPFEYPLSASAVETLLGKIADLRFAQCVAGADADLDAFGLNTPRRTMTIDIAGSVVTGYDDNGDVAAEKQLDAYQLTFVCGGDANANAYYCLYRGMIYKATQFTAGFMLTQGYTTLLTASPINIPTNILTGLAWEKDGESHAYAIELVESVKENNQLETDEDGNILYSTVVTRDGQAMNSEDFLNAYRQLVSVRTVSRVSESYRLPDAQPDVTLTLTGDGLNRKIEFYPLDALHYAVSVNGVALYYIEKDMISGIAMP